VRGRAEDIQGGRRAGAVGPAHVARTPKPVHRSAGRERGPGAFGRGDGPGASRSDI